MATKFWVADALLALKESLAPLPHELNELDWKAQLSSSPASSLTITAISAALIQALSCFRRWRSTSFLVLAMRPFNALISAFHSACRRGAQAQ